MVGQFDHTSGIYLLIDATRFPREAEAIAAHQSVEKAFKEELKTRGQVKVRKDIDGPRKGDIALSRKYSKENWYGFSDFKVFHIGKPEAITDNIIDLLSDSLNDAKEL